MKAWFQSLIGIIGYFEKPTDLPEEYQRVFQSLIGIIGYFEKSIDNLFSGLPVYPVSIPNRDYRLFREVFFPLSSWLESFNP